MENRDIPIITLANKDSVQLIEGVILHPLRINKDETGGILVETLRADWRDVVSEERPFAMQYYSVTESMVARDENVWHYHPTGQEDRFLVIHGAIVVAVADKRNGSPTNSLLNLFYMHPLDNPYLLLIPKQTLHGFLVVSKEPATLLNFPTRLYNPEEEGRIPHQEAGVKLLSGEIFSWDIVRMHFR
jgi:dTDP-4-dehydrorhamnose 3,5-epimerase